MSENKYLDIDDESVWAAFQSIAHQEVFSSKSRTLRLLEYLLREELAGRGGRLKSYSIALDVFGKNESFDPALDSTVRVEMYRLRNGLSLYYAINKDDPVTIRFPKASYRALIQRRTTSSVGLVLPSGSPAAALGPSPTRKLKTDSISVPNVRLVTRNDAEDNNQLRTLVQTTILATLSQYSSINLVDQDTECPINVPSYTIEFSFTALDKHSRIDLITKYDRTGEIIAANGFTALGTNIDIIDNTVMSVGDLILYYGIIPRHAVSVDWEDNGVRQNTICIINMYDSFISDSVEEHAQVLRSLESQVESGKASAEVLSSLALTSIVTPNWHGVYQSERVLDRAAKLFDHAFEQAPENSLVLTLSMYYFCRRLPSEMERLKEVIYRIERAYSYNSLAMLEVARAKGYSLGEWDEAIRLVKKVRNIHRETDNSMFVVDTGYALLYAPPEDLITECIHSYSAGNINNLRMLAGAKLVDNYEWRQSAEESLATHGLNSVEEQISFLEALKWEPKIQNRIREALKLA